MPPRAALALVPVALLLVAGSASSAGPTGGGAASAFAVQVVLPNQPVASVGPVSAPPQAGFSAPSFQYPADGSAVSTGAVDSSASATGGAAPAASASADVANLSLFDGDIVAQGVSVRATASVASSHAGGSVAGSGFTGLQVLGSPVASPAPNERVALADWGYVLLLEQGSVPTAGTGYSGFVTGLDVHLTRDHGGLPAGSEILVGRAQASAQVAAPPPPPATTAPRAGAKPKPKPKSAPRSPNELPNVPLAFRTIPVITPPLQEKGYVFPIWGPSGFGDTFGAPRDIGWHHGDDIFASLGTPVLAVNDGVVFSVGWNRIGGNRLWLVDAKGNEFYYAHLSAYSPYAVDGAQVKAGTVLGFVGNTGDAEHTPFHLHFEIHPKILLPLGYDGAVDPTTYLDSWRHLQNLSLPAGSALAPRLLASATAPEPGAVLLQARDISSGNGLEPATLAQAFAPLSKAGEVALLAGLTFPGGGLPAAPGAPVAPPATNAAGGGRG